MITKSKKLKPVSINNNRFPAWGYVLIGFSLSIIIGVFFYCKKSSSIRNSACCSSGQDQSRITPDQCKYQPMTTARVSGTPEGHGYVCGTVASAPLLCGTVETDNVIHKLYPTLNITTTQSDMWITDYASWEKCKYHWYQVTGLCSTLINMYMYILVMGLSTNVYIYVILSTRNGATMTLARK